jgi:hypothetical protein
MRGYEVNAMGRCTINWQIILRRNGRSGAPRDLTLRGKTVRAWLSNDDGDIVLLTLALRSPECRNGHAIKSIMTTGYTSPDLYILASQSSELLAYRIVYDAAAAQRNHPDNPRLGMLYTARQLNLSLGSQMQTSHSGKHRQAITSEQENRP